MKNAKALPLPKFFKRMYRYALVILLASSLFSCDIRGKKNRGDVTAPGILPEGSVAQTTKDTTTVEIIDSVYNFGSVVDGDKVEYNYRFKNTGNKPLIIYTATASCGCTVPVKPDRPIQPGEMSFIKAVFSSAGRVGDVQKEIMVRSNAKPAFPILKLLGEVEAKK
jgi:hypothetical protein